MPRSNLVIHALASIWLLSGLAPARSGEPPTQLVSVGIEDFSYLDTSGEPTDQSAAHQMRLQAFMTTFRHEVEADDRYRLVPSSCVSACAGDGSAVSNQPHTGSQAGANILIIGAIQKLSTLVQNARVRAIDVAANRIVFERIYTFRGDNDESWRRAETFVSRDLRAALVPAEPVVAAATSAPIKLALFDFELEDSSAAPSETPSDATELAHTNDAVRQLLTQSGRYLVVPIGGSANDAAKNHTVRGCDGCDANIALELGADQSLLGVIGRISRTEYTVSFRLRDARTGRIVSGGDSGLRMGANYSWSRGAVHLIRDQLLEAQARQ
jgi:hypothetical protein